MKKTVVIYNTTTAKKVVFENTEASTRGDIEKLIAEYNKKQEDVEDMIATEGLSWVIGFTRDTLNTKESALPEKIVKANGEVMTDKIVIMLTVAKHKIKSGASREELYRVLKGDSYLQMKIREKFNRHYTNVSTKDLNSVLDVNEEELRENEVKTEAYTEDTSDMERLVEVLKSKGLISADDAGYILGESKRDYEIDELIEEAIEAGY